MKTYRKILPIFFLSIIMSGCVNHKTTDINKDNKINQEQPQNKKINTDNLSELYGRQVDLSDLIGMPQINNDQANQLLSMISGKENDYRSVMEQEIMKKNLSFEEVCLGLSGTLCDINNEIYKGSRFGLSLYSKVSKSNLLEDNKASLAIRIWSVNWIKDSIEQAKKINKECKEDSDCISNNSSNPLVEIYANALNQNNDKLVNEYLHVKLLSQPAKRYLFDVGFLSGYSIGYNVDKKIPLVDKYKGKKTEVSLKSNNPKKEIIQNKPKVTPKKSVKATSSRLPTPKLEVVKSQVSTKNNVQDKIDDLIDSMSK